MKLKPENVLFMRMLKSNYTTSKVQDTVVSFTLVRPFYRFHSQTIARTRVANKSIHNLTSQRPQCLCNVSEKHHSPKLDNDRQNTTGGESKGNTHYPAKIFWFAALGELGLGIIGYVAARLFHMKTEFLGGPDLIFTSGAVVTAVFWTVPFVAVFKLLEQFPTDAYRATEEIVRKLMSPRNAAEIFLFCLAAGVGEEVLFRGFLQSLFARQLNLGNLKGCIIASLFFGASHSVTPLYFLLSTLAGGYFGWLFVSSGSILQPIIVHTLYDVVVALLIRRRLAKEESKVP